MASNDIQVKLTLTGLQQFQKGLKQVSADTKKFGAALSNVSDSAIKFGQNLAKGAAIAGAAIAAVTARFAEFESAFTNVVTLLDDSSFSTGTLAQGISELEEGLISLRASSGQTFDTLNKGLFDLVSAGVSAGDAIETLAIASDLALAGGTDVAIAVDGITTALGAFGKQAGTTQEIADKFFTAQKFGKTTIEELAGAIGLVAATSAASGVSFDELLASVSAATLTGIRTKAAFTGLKAAIAGILKPTAAAQEEAERLGIEFDGTALRSKGLIGLLQRVTQSSNFNADSFSRLFGSVEAMNFAQAIATRNFSATNRILGALSSQTQIAATFNDALAVKQDTVSFATSQLVGQFDALAVQIGKTLAPAIKSIITLLGDLVEEFGPAVIAFFEDVGERVEAFVRQFGGANLPETIEIITAAFIKVKDAALEFFNILSGIVTIIGQVFKAAKPLIDELSESLDTFAKFIGFADGATLLLTFAIGQFTGANRLAIDAIIAILLFLTLLKSSIRLVASTIITTLIPAFIAVAATPFGVFLIGASLLIGVLIAKNVDLKDVLNDVIDTLKGLAAIILNVGAAISFVFVKLIALAIRNVKDLISNISFLLGNITFDEKTAEVERHAAAYAKAGDAIIAFSNGVTQTLSPLKEQEAQLQKNAETVDELRARLNKPIGSIPIAEQILFTAQGVQGRIGAATGGLLQGPGTGTSDDIPLMGSDGEFMMRAKSVRKFGTNFMHMINRGILPKFADGGLVSATTSGFTSIPSAVVAGAGPNKALRPVNLTIPGVGTFPFFDEKSTAESLQAALRKSNLNKSAKLPNWYK